MLSVTYEPFMLSIDMLSAVVPLVLEQGKVLHLGRVFACKYFTSLKILIVSNTPAYYVSNE